MYTFAKERQIKPKIKSASPEKACRIFSRLRTGLNSLQQPIGNQAVQRMLPANAEEFASDAATTPSSLLSPFGGSVSAATLRVAHAAFKWKRLVDHAARYDFKAHSDSMDHPHSLHCPDDNCIPKEVGVITLCPDAATENCYESDLPGNLFYALIGKFVGWSELTLQLGSQLAELTDTRVTPSHPRVTWDSPEDTAGIHLGFGLPLPLTRSALCGAVGPARSRLSIKAGCADCLEITSARIR